MTNMLIKLFLIASSVNLFYELLHSQLYITCLEAPLKKFIQLMLKAATFDGLAIVIIYSISYKLFENKNIFTNKVQFIVFLIAALIFAYAWEIHSLNKKKWEYANNMPKLFGVGITPLVQLAVTGIISLYFIFLF